MTAYRRKTILIILDLFIIWCCILASYAFRFSGSIPPTYTGQIMTYGLVAGIFCIVLMYGFKLYGRVWQYASIGEMIAILKAVTISFALSYITVYGLTGKWIPLSIFLHSFETSLLVIGGTRFAWRVLRDTYFRKNPEGRLNVLIIGAGNCGAMVAKELKGSRTSNLHPAAFIDDDPLKQGQRVLGIPVYGGREFIPEAVENLEIHDIVIAMPSVSKGEISRLIDICKTTKANLKIIPSINALIDGQVSVQHIRQVEVEDLLGREPVKLDMEGIARYVTDKTILVTGAGGSIGSELCRQIARFQPKKLLLLGHGENSIYAIESELKTNFPQLTLAPVIADVQDRQRVDEVFAKYRPEIVFHAAAHKHVPLMEANPGEAVKNNILGTKNVADSADRYRTERFVLISTDKAVNPTSVMGTTKRIAEMYIQSKNQKSHTRYAAVRFGNVLGSRGSVIPRFKEQIARGGPVTVTHPEMVRYFMTIPEAVQLVIQAGALSQGGEVFILDMGEPVKIVDLARDLIRLSGFEPGTDIAIEFSGIRPGEKLYEELLTNEEGLTSTVHNRIFIGQPSQINHTSLSFAISDLETAAQENGQTLRDTLQQLVPTYSKPVYHEPVVTGNAKEYDSLETKVSSHPVTATRKQAVTT